MSSRTGRTRRDSVTASTRRHSSWRRNSGEEGNLRRRLLLGRRGRVPPDRRRDEDRGRLRRWPSQKPELPGRLLAHDRPRRGGRGHLRPRARLLRAAARGLLEQAQPDAEEPPGLGHRRSVPLGGLLPRRGAARGGRAVEGRPRRLGPLPQARRHPDRAGTDVLPRRRVPPALPGEAGALELHDAARGSLLARRAPGLIPGRPLYLRALAAALAAGCLLLGGGAALLRVAAGARAGAGLLAAAARSAGRVRDLRGPLLGPALFLQLLVLLLVLDVRALAGHRRASSQFCEISSTISPTFFSFACSATSAWARTPTTRPSSSTTGSRRTWWVAISRSASSRSC